MPGSSRTVLSEDCSWLSMRIVGTEAMLSLYYASLGETHGRGPFDYARWDETYGRGSIGYVILGNRTIYTFEVILKAYGNGGKSLGQ